MLHGEGIIVGSVLAVQLHLLEREAIILGAAHSLAIAVVVLLLVEELLLLLLLQSLQLRPIVNRFKHNLITNNQCAFI